MTHLTGQLVRRSVSTDVAGDQNDAARYSSAAGMRGGTTRNGRTDHDGLVAAYMSSKVVRMLRLPTEAVFQPKLQPLV